MSDLHHEFDRRAGARRPAALELSAVNADVTVLAGDIDVGPAGLDWAMEQAERARRPVLYVAGNHEFYGQSLREHIAALKALARGSRVHVLERDEVVIGATRFLGAVLWTDFALNGMPQAPKAIIAAWAAMNDYRHILNGASARLRPQDTLSEHGATVDWLRGRLAEPGGTSTVVITHHAPSPRSIPAGFAHQILRPALASDLHRLIGPPVSLWVHGHIHHAVDYTIGGTRVVCNPRGYYPDRLVRRFQPSLVLEVPDPESRRSGDPATTFDAAGRRRATPAS